MSKRKFYFTIAGLSAILVVGAYISIHMGSVKIPISAAFQALCPNFQLLAEKNLYKVSEVGYQKVMK